MTRSFFGHGIIPNIKLVKTKLNEGTYPLSH